jgi:hypothetical protein
MPERIAGTEAGYAEAALQDVGVVAGHALTVVVTNYSS